MQEDSRTESPTAEGSYRPGEWDNCPNVTTLCPGCQKPIRVELAGLHACKCTDILWRRHPLARGPNRPWQVVFLDDLLPS